MFARARAEAAPCPACATESMSVRGRYQRRVTDTPIGGRPVWLQLRVRRFNCRNDGCAVWVSVCRLVCFGWVTFVLVGTCFVRLGGLEGGLVGLGGGVVAFGVGVGVSCCGRLVCRVIRRLRVRIWGRCRRRRVRCCCRCRCLRGRLCGRSGMR
ncbi:transposase family protein [Dactylosporangium sp. CA-152071]|uniref:transposase family protein n=1 Tax=Dactylosporangium sp. CA-152071 TaxID=3239933 RepID=UPI003D8E6CC2